MRYSNLVAKTAKGFVRIGGYFDVKRNRGLLLDRQADGVAFPSEQIVRLPRSVARSPLGIAFRADRRPCID